MTVVGPSEVLILVRRQVPVREECLDPDPAGSPVPAPEGNLDPGLAGNPDPGLAENPDPGLAGRNPVPAPEGKTVLPGMVQTHHREKSEAVVQYNNSA